MYSNLCKKWGKIFVVYVKILVSKKNLVTKTNAAKNQIDVKYTHSTYWHTHCASWSVTCVCAMFVAIVLIWNLWSQNDQKIDDNLIFNCFKTKIEWNLNSFDAKHKYSFRVQINVKKINWMEKIKGNQTKLQQQKATAHTFPVGMERI